jgi:hypothetical protein
MTTTTKITSQVCATGSWGIYAGSNGGLQKVWFCGRGRYSHVLTDHCVHATRDEARRCRRERGTK